MKLDDAQKQKVTSWIQEGLQLAEIQKRLLQEFSITMTYMEVRFLVDDLKLLPKDIERPKSQTPQTLGGPAAPSSPPGSPQPSSAGSGPAPEGLPPSGGAPSGAVSVTVDKVTRPGSLVSGQVAFSDGQSASWYLDQMGRLGMAAKQQGYKPSQADLQSFQTALETELAKLGF